MPINDAMPTNGITNHSPNALANNPRPTINNAKTVTEIETCLNNLHSQYDDVTVQLEDAINSHDEVERQLRRLDLTRARLGSLAVNARGISHDMLSTPAATAGRISDSVERLDLEQARVKATLEVVEQVAELKSCVLGVMGSMGGPQDWEAAAEYIDRASKIPSHVIDSGFAEQVVPTAEVPDSPRTTLDDAAQSLCQLFLREFDSAVAAGDGAKITRFFKMFPLIGRSREGLEAYGRYVCQGVAQRARARLQTGAGSNHSEGQVYTTAFTKLFEHIAQVVDGHSGLVERHYGEGTMVSVMERLHREADVQGGIILDTWNDERTIDRKLTDVKSYAYSFLVQSFLPQQKALVGTPRSQSPAPGASGGSRAQAEEGIDMKEVDRVLSEAGTMLGHWSLYLRFIASSAQPTEEAATNGSDHKPLVTPDFIRISNLPKKVGKVLVEPFNIFATFFLRRSVERAFQLDEAPSGLTLNVKKQISANPPYITSAVDDVMYVVNQILQRALATSQAEIVVSVSTTIGRVLGSDFIGMVQRKMRDESYPKAAVQGAPPPDDKVLAFLVLINNLDVAIDYIKRIVRSHIEEGGTGGSRNGPRRPLDELFPLGRDASAVGNALRNLEGGFSAKANELINDGLSVTFQQVLKPRMRPMLTEAFRDTDYSISDEDEYERGRGEEDEDSSVKAYIQPAWEGLIKPMKRILTERLSDRITATTINQLANLLERRIWSYYGRVSDVGAVALERDVSEIINTASKGESFKMREAFNRCIQIVTIMNLEDDEWDEIVRSKDADADWILDDKERLRARNIVRDRE